MKVYHKETGAATEHHPVDAREIVRERGEEYTLRNPRAPKEVAATEGEEKETRSAEAALAAEKAKEAEAQARKDHADRDTAVDRAKRQALKLREEAEELARKAIAAPKAGKTAAEKAAKDAEQAADEADSEVARLLAGGELHPEQRVAIK